MILNHHLHHPSSQQCVCQWFQCDSQLVAQERVLYHAFRLLVLKMLGFTMRRACDRCSYTGCGQDKAPKRCTRYYWNLWNTFLCHSYPGFWWFLWVTKGYLLGFANNWRLAFGVCEPGALHWAMVWVNGVGGLERLTVVYWLLMVFYW